MLAREPYGDTVGASLKLTWTSDDLTLKSITAYRRFHGERLLDHDSSPLRVLEQADELKQHQFSQEFQLFGNIGKRFNYIGGIYYFDEGLFYDSRIVIGPGTNTDRKPTLGTKSYAAYLNVTLEPLPGLRLTAGGRYTHEKRSIDTIVTVLNSPTILLAGKKSADFNDFAPKIEVDYKFTPTIFGYLSAAKGFKSGGFNGRAGVGAALDAFKPETTWTYEAGLRTQFFDRRFTLNVTGFYSDIKDLQEQVAGATSTGQILQSVFNAAGARIKGVEVEADARVTNYLRFFGNFGYTDAKYTAFRDATAGDLSGLKLPYTPKVTYLIGGEIKAPIAASATALFNLDYSWRKANFTDVPNTLGIKQPSYGLLNGRASVKFANGLALSVYGKNLTNKRVVQSGLAFLPSFGFASAYFTDPRTYGVEAAWNF